MTFTPEEDGINKFVEAIKTFGDIQLEEDLDKKEEESKSQKRQKRKKKKKKKKKMLINHK